eukprot:SAG31_NODE_7513_length_1667_cov_1.089286_2_plen_87_part_00
MPGYSAAPEEAERLHKMELVLEKGIHNLESKDEHGALPESSVQSNIQAYHHSQLKSGQAMYRSSVSIGHRNSDMTLRSLSVQMMLL